MTAKTGAGQIHLIKLCVGVSCPEELIAYRAEQQRKAEQSGKIFQSAHITRMFPRRADELQDGGSLYWVMSGVICARQAIINLESITTESGTKCRIILNNEIIPTLPRPRRPFQGWRYLSALDAPADLAEGTEMDDLPANLREHLREFGVL